MKMQIFQSRLRNNSSGQDLIEYVLVAGFVAVAAGALMPGIAESIATVFAKVVAAIKPSRIGPGPELGTVKIICAVMAVLFLGVIMLRRLEARSNGTNDEE